MSATKLGESTTTILKLIFFTINLHFVKSNLRSTYRKLNFPLTSSYYFFFLPLEMQKKRLEQTKVYHSFSHFLWKETASKPLQVAAAKAIFLQCVCYWHNLLRWMFFLVCDNWKTLLFVKVYRYSETFEASCCCFLWSQCFERSPYFMRYLHNNSMMLISKFQSKAD